MCQKISFVHWFEELMFCWNFYLFSLTLSRYVKFCIKFNILGCVFCLRIKRNHCIEIEHLVGQRLDELGIVPGTSLYFQGKELGNSACHWIWCACKWKRNYGAWKVDEAWFILTDLGSYRQLSMLTSNGWALKKCLEIVKQEATIWKELA
jgi:hypothetical protein